MEGKWKEWKNNLVHAFDEESVADYVHSNVRKRDEKRMNRVLSHLLRHGWKIETKRDTNMMRKRYISPGGKIFTTLKDACIFLGGAQHVGVVPKAVIRLPAPESSPEQVGDRMEGKKREGEPPLGDGRIVVYKELVERKKRPSGRGAFVVPDIVLCLPAPAALPFLVGNQNKGKKRKGETPVDGRIQVFKKPRRGQNPSSGTAKEVAQLMKTAARSPNKFFQGDGRIEAYKKPIKGQRPSGGAVKVVAQMKKSLRPPSEYHVHVEKEICFEAVREYSKYEFFGATIKAGDLYADLSALRMKVKKHLAAEGWEILNVPRNGRMEGRYISPKGVIYFSIKQACTAYVRTSNMLSETSSSDSTVSAEKSAPVSAPQRPPEERKTRSKRCCRKRRFDDYLAGEEAPVATKVKPYEPPSFTGDKPYSVLSWLFHMSIIKKGEIVRYVNEEDGTRASGKVVREGISCKCCKAVFSLPKFVAHAGSSNHQPAAYVFFSDGSSLLERQEKGLKEAVRLRESISLPHKKPKGEPYGNEGVCSRNCTNDGEVLCCDTCPAVYHLPCVGLEEAPDGDWNCPSCECAICCQGISLNPKTVRCDQCQRNFHLSCLVGNEQTEGGIHMNDSWLCSKQCSMVFAGLIEIAGKPNPTGIEGLTWRLLRPDEQIDNNCKLWLAVDVFDECFASLYDPSGRDLARDIVFNRRSVCKRVNFKGFYTFIIEKDDAVVTAAVIRIFGGKVAEMPLIGTRFGYRNRGLGRFLVTELEKILSKLGVEMLVLPAASEVLNMWVESFKFSESTPDDKLQHLRYIFMSFQGTTRCQKLISSNTNNETNNEIIGGS